MGHLVGDKKAVDVTWPSSTVGNHGDLYRVNGFTGFLINSITATDTVRGRALEIGMNRAWKVKMPAALNPAVGALLAWNTDATTFRDGETHLVADGTASASPAVVRVVTAKNANGYAEVVLVRN